MRTNTAKERMQQGKPAIGAVVGLGAPLAAEYLSLAGFDFILVDNQHGAWDENSSALAFRSISLGAAMPMARVQQNDFYAIGALLDRGALGIVVPLVNYVDEAEAAARAVRYPPDGGRSIALGAIFHGQDYTEAIDDEVFLAVQIESEVAVEFAEDILSVDGIDGCWIGPADLANSMGVDLSTQQGKERHEAAIVNVLEACRKTNKIPGIAASSSDEARRWIEKGFLFVTAAFDSVYVIDGAQRTLQALGR